jgi:Mn2+/Fe2+ NRAMP family transporter
MFKALKQFLRVLGPGIITGAADDDPSGIATYSQTGVQFGYGQLWTAVFTLPLLAGVQEACSRIGLVSGKGIAAVMREHFSKPVLYAVVLLVLVANTINIGADIGAMAAAAGLLFPCPS